MNRAQLRAKTRHATEVEQRRRAERKDARDFLVHGDLDGRHSEHCIHVAEGRRPCGRDYNPTPYAEAIPDPTMYVGTGIGALYGLANTERYLWTLAGWNITKRREFA